MLFTTGLKMISFIVPAYNSEETIRLCLKSIFAQTSETNEVIVVDNNSTDSTGSIAKEFPVRLIHEPKQGRSHARNAGAKVAKNEFLAFIDSDVILDPNWAENALKGFDVPTVGGVAGPIVPAEIMGSACLNSFRKRAGEESTDGEFNLLHLTVKESPMINSAACMYLRTVFEKTGGFDPELDRHEDIDFSKRVMLSGFDLASVPEARARVIFNGSGWGAYFKRTFEDGYSKQEYLQKWRDYLFAGKGNQSLRVTMFLNEVLLSFLKGILKCERYYFLRSLNSAIKAMGQVSKIFTFRSVKKYHCDMIREKAYVFRNGLPIIEFDLRLKTVTKIRKEN